MVLNNKKHSLFLIPFIIFAFTQSVQCVEQFSVGKLTVLNHTDPQAVKKTVTLTPLSYHEHLPNLEMLRVRVIRANPFDACQHINSSTIYPDPYKNYADTFLLVDGQSGSCNYWKKAEIAKEAMVKGVIIINDDPQKNANRPADYTEGLFLSFLIRPQDALLIVPSENSQFQGQLSISQTTENQQKKKIYLWLSSLNAQSYQYLNWWNETLRKVPELQQKVDWQPKYVFYGKSSDQSRHVYSCVCNGLFCSPQYHGKYADALVKEDLRQKLIFKYHPEKFLKYIKLFNDRCLQTYLKDKYTEECSKTQMINAGIDEANINNKIYNFEQKCDEDKELFGELLTDKGRFSMIGTYPIILLNREILEVNNQAELQAALCRKLSLEKSEGCIQSYRTTTNEIVISVAFFVLVLAGLFGVGFFIVMCYKNRLRKEMHKEVKMQVSTAVEHYFQLSQDGSMSKH